MYVILTVLERVLIVRESQQVVVKRKRVKKLKSSKDEVTGDDKE